MESLYEREVAGLVDRVETRLAAAEQADPNKAEGALSEAATSLTRLDSAIRQLSIEAQSKSNAETRAALERRVNEFKSKAKKFRKKYNNLERNISHAALMGSSGGMGSDIENGQGGRGSDEQQQRLMHMNGRMNTTNDRLHDARRDMQEMEDVAVGILGNLDDQGRQIKSAHGKVKQTMGVMGEANGLLAMMERNARTKKNALLAAVGVLALLFLWAAYRIVIG